MDWNVEIAFCEETGPFLTQLSGLIRDAFQEQGIPSHFTFYSSPGMLQQAMEDGGRYDIYFLNADLPHFHGFNLAKKISWEFPHSFLIFTAQKEETIFSSLRFHPFAFLRKSRLEDDLPWALKELVKYFQDHRGPYCQIYDVLGNQYSIALDSILYLEAEDKYVNLITREGGFYLRNTLSNLEKMLAPYGIIRIHRSFLVNPIAIDTVKYGKVILSDGQQLPLGRSHTSSVRSAVAERRGPRSRPASNQRKEQLP